MARHNFRDLKVWQKSRFLVKETYEICSTFPNEEKYGLIPQCRRSTISISSNISEGAGRGTDKDFSHFLSMSEGSSNELLNLMFLAFDLNYITKSILDDISSKIEEVIRMINGFRKQLNNKKM